MGKLLPFTARPNARLDEDPKIAVTVRVYTEDQGNALTAWFRANWNRFLAETGTEWP